MEHCYAHDPMLRAGNQARYRFGFDTVASVVLHSLIVGKTRAWKPTRLIDGR